jgi:hypothetical protein
MYDLEVYAVQRTASGQWLMRAPSDDPFLPAVSLRSVISHRLRPPDLLFLGEDFTRSPFVSINSRVAGPSR